MAGIPVTLTDGKHGARFTKSGELVVSSISYDTTQFYELAAVDTAYNFYEPKGDHQFIITAVLAYGDKQVGSNTNATVIIYEASAADSTVVDKVLIQFEIGQNQSLPFTSLRLKTAEGKFINAKTDDDDIHMTIMGYFIAAID